MEKKNRRSNARLPHWPPQQCFAEPVVGESYYKESFQVIFNECDDEGVLFGVAELKPEPNNQHDNNAVGVFFDQKKVGHLSRTSAEIYQNVIVSSPDVLNPPITTAYIQIKKMRNRSGETIFSAALDMTFDKAANDLHTIAAHRLHPEFLPILDRGGFVSAGYVTFINADLCPEVVAKCCPGDAVDCWSPPESEDIHLFLPGSVGGSGRFSVTDVETLKRIGFPNVDAFNPVIRAASGNVVVVCAKLPS